MKKNKDLIANNLAHLMKIKGLNKTKLAALCGVTDATIGNILNGQDTKVNTLNELANALGVDIKVFFENNDSEFSSTGGIAANGCNNTVNDNTYNNNGQLPTPAEGFINVIGADGKISLLPADFLEEYKRLKQTCEALQIEVMELQKEKIESLKKQVDNK